MICNFLIPCPFGQAGLLDISYSKSFTIQNTRIMENKVHFANKDEFYPPIPTKGTQRRRTNFFLQLFSFFRLNLKIMMIVVKGHS